MCINNIEVPKQLEHSFFFSEEKVSWPQNNINIFCPEIPFIHEIAYYSIINSYKPWENITESIPVLLNEWDKLKKDLVKLFETRDKKNTMLPMKRGISFFIELLYWTNEKPVVLVPMIINPEWKYKPVNVKERFEFLLSRPNLYHSFIQLSELMAEMEKQYAKKLVIEKASKH